MKMYVPPAIWSDVHWEPAGPLTVQTRSDCASSVSGAGLAPPCGPILTMLTACVLTTLVGSTKASFLACAPPSIRSAAPPATASSMAKPVPTSLGAQDPRYRDRVLRLPRIPNDYPSPVRCASGCCEKLLSLSPVVTVGSRRPTGRGRSAASAMAAASRSECGQAESSTRFAGMPPRRADPARLLAAVNAQRAALGRPAWSGPATAEALAAGCVSDVLAAIDPGGSPPPAALRRAARPPPRGLPSPASRPPVPGP